MLTIGIISAAIAVLSLVLTIVWHCKYDIKLHKLDIKEKEQHQQELLRATLNCYPLPREDKKLPQFRIENTGKHPANDVALELPDDFAVRIPDLFPYKKIAPGQRVDVIYVSRHHGYNAVPVKLTFTDGLSRRDEICFVQL